MNAKIGIVTVLYKSESVLPDFFQSLETQTYKNFVLYIIDNKSPDNSLLLSEKLKAKSTFETVIVANDDNYGIAKGNNIGIVRALNDNCDYILLSNNDVVFDSKTLKILLGAQIEESADMVVPKISFYDTNLIWCAGGRFNKRTGWTNHLGYLENDNDKFNKKVRVSYSPTCFMIIRKAVFEDIGMMDENYFVYWDDTDFVYRALKNGKTLWYIPNANIKHKESTSTGLKSDFSIYYLHRNMV